MALGMKTADMAVSKTGMENLRADINKKAKNAASIADVASKEFKELENTIRTYWQGVDCDNFITDLKVAVKSLNGSINTYSNLITKSLDVYYNEFLSMQKSTYKPGSVKI